MSDHNELESLLRDRTKKVSETQGLGGILALAWRTILFNLNMEIGNMEFLLKTYIERMRKNTADPSVAGYYNKGNIRRELAKNTMTFKVFMKALRVLDVTHVRIAFELTHRMGRKTLHEVHVDIDDQIFEGESKTSMEENDEAD